MKLEGKVAIVTGAGQGMGRGIALKLAEEGAKVFVTSLEDPTETVEMIRANGGVAEAGIADISKLEDIPRMFDECEAVYGKADIFVANAGIAVLTPIAEVTPEIFDKAFYTNARGTLFCLKEAGARLKDGGHIVVISSSSVTDPVPGMCVYSSSKAAIQLMATIAAQEFAPRKITVNAVQPGVTVTPSATSGLPQEFLDAMIEKTALKRLAQPEDIAKVVAFFASDEAAWITGQVVLADGGVF